MIFKAGDFVKFKGLRRIDTNLKEDIKMCEGKLIPMDHNTTVKGVLAIEGDQQRMMFMPNGEVYCHPKFGICLSKLVPFTVGEEVNCFDPIEGFLTINKNYIVTGLREEEGRIVITDDTGKEGWYKANRFITTAGIKNVQSQNTQETPTQKDEGGNSSGTGTPSGEGIS
jgi:hypothetical protein